VRSGIAITAGLGLGLTCSAAARFSCLLAVPGIAMARAYDLLKLLSADEAVEWQMMSLGLVESATTGYACIHVLLEVIEKIGLLPFTLYRLLVAGPIVVHFG
jgi:undecaprenyl-diphosphatase